MRENYKIDEKSVSLTKMETLKRIIGYFSEYKLKIALIILMVVLMSCIIVSIPLFTERAVDVNIKGKDIRGLCITIGIAVSLCFIWWGLSVAKQHSLARMTNEIVFKVRKDCYDNVLTLPVNFFDTRPSGRILARLVGDMEGFKTITLQLVNNLIPNILLLVMIVAIMLASNAILSISAFVVLPFLVFFSYWIIYRGYSNWEKYRKKESNHTAFVFEDYSGIRALQSFCAEAESEREEDRILEENEVAWKKAVKFSESLNIVITTTQGLGYFLLFLIAVGVLDMGPNSVGQLLAYSGYMALFWQPIRSLASMYTQLVNNLASASRVFSLMDEENNIPESLDAPDLVVDKGSVEFENVSFAYPDEPDVLVLEDLSFHVDGGKRIALVGPTGAGKTTIINLIARFYDPVEGSVCIDGQDIANVRSASLRKYISLMPQDSVLFTGSIRENLLYGKEVSEKQMKDVCTKLGINSFIEAFPDGYDTSVDKAMLSQGQKQLLSLARVIIADPAILILDEATSNVDTNTELMVQRGLEILMKGRTSFVVAHRLSTIVSADEIFVVSNKGIMEKGNHDSLMAMNGEYAALYRAQFEFD